MRVKFTLHRSPAPVDLEVTADGTSTVGDLARALVLADPRGAADPGSVTLAAAESAGPRLIDPTRAVAESGIRSGQTVQVVAAPAYIGDDAPAAVVRVLSGPLAGSELPLRAGSNVVGRDPGADVVLDDALVSKRHARINVDAGIEIIDLGSANGLVMGGEQIARTSLSPDDVVLLGSTEISVIPLTRPGTVHASTSTVEVVRTPRVVPRYEKPDFPAPKPPKALTPQRLPFIALIAPLLMGVFLYVITQNVLSVVFIALSPLIMLAAWLDQVLSARSQYKRDVQRFEASLEHFETLMEREQGEERAVRIAEVPALADALSSLSSWGDLTWTHRPEHPQFLTARLGTGRLPSRVGIELNGLDETEPDYSDRLLAVRERFALIDDVPVVADLREAGNVGFAGGKDAADAARASQSATAAARAFAMQLVATHSPAELVVTAFTSPATRRVWSWLEWLPHTSSPHTPLDGPHLAANPGTAAGLLARLEGLVEERSGGKEGTALRGPVPSGAEPEPAAPAVPAVVVLVEDGATVDRARLTRLAERGPDVGVHLVWVAATAAAIPAACRTFLVVDGAAEGTAAGIVRRGLSTTPVRVELLDEATAVAWARVLAPTVDAGAPVDDESDLPRAVSFIDLADADIGADAAVIADRWRESDSITVRDGRPPERRKKEGNLRALVGHGGGGAFHLDLRSQGPHALVGGTTGAGKSEFLQSWVLGMASAHSPDRVTFLFVDYKGGSAFADCVDLPHTVGLVTDLSPHLVRRALTSLRAELRYREHLLNRKKAKDLVSLERTGDPETPPSLIIVVDEFAALVGEVPEFVDGVVDVAQRGRSLGLHLILATQRPAGVIKDNLRANTNLRVALRMADTEDSSDILGTPMAAHFDPSIPGRGAAKTGPGRIATFQTGYVGGWTTDEKPQPQIDIRELDFGVGARWDVPAAEVKAAADPGPTDIARIVRTVRSAASALAIPAPRRPWLDELAAAYDLARLPSPRTDERLLLGVLDDPATQSQPTTSYEPDRDGNVAIFGTGGSGKSTALRTLAVSAAITPRGGPVHVYGLDFGAGGLRMLEGLLHVGAVIDGDDGERVTRLLRMLRDIVDERSARYGDLRAGTITEYRRLAERPDEARIVVLIDGLGAFREQYEFAPGSAGWFTLFSQIAVDGRQVGVHFVMTGDRPNALPTSIASTVQKRFVLRLATDDDYLLVGAPKDVLTPASPPGRAILDGDEMQFAVLGGSANMAVQARELERLATAMERQGVVAAPRVGRLPEQVALASLPATTAKGDLVIGLADEDLGPLGIDPHGAFLLAGPPASGRTTALETIGRALRRSDPARPLVHLSARRSGLRLASDLRYAATGPSAVADLAGLLVDAIDAGTLAAPAILVEHLTEFSGTEAESPLDRLIRAADRAEGFVVGEGETSTWGQAWTLAQPFKAARQGLLLAPSDVDGDTLFGLSLGRVKRADFPVGRGFAIHQGRARRAQIAVSDGTA
ncbi:FtsK/SpoIIIE domain-containing protein [Microbacterium kyungheense]|uniref:S-DNA-T family DNA segregation ATPase FtsK/SpoIIIE n=1 Tax=Microbacterium kyungheense TaxID=1263636 RepID=A0A543ERW7_9MICO|nr:FtsK/SpoIIIE domain-containing protein [Microbacterium kyungheense]TQM24337.1 S-DNA-T family DNA segregation ATPase FtsK/SpoIIIE [Microbacterium kyungheense]